MQWRCEVEMITIVTTSPLCYSVLVCAMYYRLMFARAFKVAHWIVANTGKLFMDIVWRKLIDKCCVLSQNYQWSAIVAVQCYIIIIGITVKKQFILRNFCEWNATKFWVSIQCGMGIISLRQVNEILIARIEMWLALVSIAVICDTKEQVRYISIY